MRVWLAGALVLMAASAALQAQPVLIARTDMQVNFAQLYWPAVTGATSYVVRRSSSYPNWDTQMTVSSSTASFAVAANNAYVFSVVARNAQGQDLAVTTNALVTTFALADNNLTLNQTRVKAQHITELRSAVAAACAVTGRPAPVWTYPTLALIHKEDMSDLRTAANGVLQGIGITPPAYTDPTLTNVTKVRKVHLDEVRARIRNYPEYPLNTLFTISEPYFSPNGDGVKDATNVIASMSALADVRWQLMFRNSAGIVIRTVSGSGNVISYPWDGRNDAGAVQADGIYTVYLIEQTSGLILNSINIVLDNTAPAVAISAPSDSSTVSNVHQNGATDIAVKGQIQDAHANTWNLEATGPWNAHIANGTGTYVSGSTLGTWHTAAGANGAYTLTLSAQDWAGNSGTAVSHVTVGNFSARQNVQEINAVAGESVQYISTVPFPVTEQITVRDGAGIVIRTLVDTTRAAGTFTDSWDGKNDAGALMADSIYYYVARVTASPDVLTWDTTQQITPGGQTQYRYPYCYNTSGVAIPCDSSASSFDFDPWAGKPLRIAYCVDESGTTVPPACGGTAPALVTAVLSNDEQTSATCNSTNCFFNEFRPSGLQEMDWFGMNTAGAYIAGAPRMSIIRKYDAMPSNAVLVYGTEPKLRYVEQVPLMLSPGYGASQTFKFDVDAYGSRTVTITAEFLESSPSHTVLRTVTTAGAGDGTHSVIWDGRADNGAFVAPGVYIVRITATDSGGSKARTMAMTTVRY